MSNRKKSESEKLMKNMSIGSAFCMILFGVMYKVWGGSVYLALAITAGTIFYHMVMRLVVGRLFYVCVKKQLNYHSAWFVLKPFERTFYKKMKVKSWKDKLPTYYPEDFSVKNHTMEELIQTMCISEIGHETMIVCSYLTLFFAIPFGELPVFLITAIAAGAVDAVFVVTQRFNRDRLVRIVDKRNNIHQKGK